MTVLTATISGKITRPDLGKSPSTAYVEAATVSSVMTFTGVTITGRQKITIGSDGTASLELPQTGQSGQAPPGAMWRIVARASGYPDFSNLFTLTADTTWDEVFTPSDIVYTPSYVAQAQAAADAAAASAAAAASSGGDPKAIILASTHKPTPADADIVGFLNSADSDDWAHMSWDELHTALGASSTQSMGFIIWDGTGGTPARPVTAAGVPMQWISPVKPTGGGTVGGGAGFVDGLDLWLVTVS